MSVIERKVDDSPEQIIDQMGKYWRQGQEGSFHSIYLAIQKIKNLAIETRRSALQELSAKENANMIVEFKRKLKSQVQELRQLEDRMKPMSELVDAGYQYVFPATDQGNFSAFSQRVDMLKEDVAKVYKDALYPFLLTLRNAEMRWRPNNIVCQLWDTYSWYTVKDPKAEFENAFPTKN